MDREFHQDKFTYDANRNQTTRLVDGVSYTLAYDEENRIETVTDTTASQTWTFHYDGYVVLCSIAVESQAASTKIFQ